MWSVLCMWVQVLSPRECCMWVKSVKWMWCEEMWDVRSVEWVVNVSVRSVLAMTSTYKQQTHTTTCSKYISKHVTWWNMRATHCVCEHPKWTQRYTHENAHATHKTNTRHTHMLICTKTNNTYNIFSKEPVLVSTWNSQRYIYAYVCSSHICMRTTHIITIHNINKHTDKQCTTHMHIHIYTHSFDHICANTHIDDMYQHRHSPTCVHIIML